MLYFYHSFIHSLKKVYIDDEDDDTVQWLKPSHKDDILCLAFYAPNTLASCSYDGDIYIWAMETGRIAMCFNYSVGSCPLSPPRYRGTCILLIRPVHVTMLRQDLVYHKSFPPSPTPQTSIQLLHCLCRSS